jgi:hypothetical protein
MTDISRGSISASLSLLRIFFIDHATKSWLWSTRQLGQPRTVAVICGCHRGSGTRRAPANCMSNRTYPTLLPRYPRPGRSHKNYVLAVAERVRADGRMEHRFTPSYGFRVLGVWPTGRHKSSSRCARPSRST